MASQDGIYVGRLDRKLVPRCSERASPPVDIFGRWGSSGILGEAQHVIDLSHHIQ
jgi:hypothetical protein